VANMQVSSSAQTTDVAKAAEKPKTASDTVKSHLQSIRNAMFGKTGKAILAGATAGALLGGAPGAVAGGAIGAGAALTVKLHENFKEQGVGKRMLAGAAAGTMAAIALATPLGAAATITGLAFATGAAQKAASAVGDFLSKHLGGGDKEAQPAAQPIAE